LAHKTFGEIIEANRRRYDMATRTGPGTGAVGVTPLGDRPGTTTVPQVTSWKGTAAGRARALTLGFFLAFTFVHVAAEARYSD
jgi:hypothetical protein